MVPIAITLKDLYLGDQNYFYRLTQINTLVEVLCILINTDLYRNNLNYAKMLI